jgi:hypothetical protein
VNAAAVRHASREAGRPVPGQLGGVAMSLFTSCHVSARIRVLGPKQIRCLNGGRQGALLRALFKVSGSLSRPPCFQYAVTRTGCLHDA